MTAGKDPRTARLEKALVEQRALAASLRADGPGFVSNVMDYAARCIELEIEDRKSRRLPDEPQANRATMVPARGSDS